MTRMTFSLMSGENRFAADAFDNQIGRMIDVTLASGATTQGTIESVRIIEGGRNAQITVNVAASANDLVGDLVGDISEFSFGPVIDG